MAKEVSGKDWECNGLFCLGLFSLILLKIMSEVRHEKANFSLQVLFVKEVVIADVIIFYYVHVWIWDTYLSKLSI